MKLHKVNCGSAEHAKPTVCWQDTQIDFGFFITKLSGKLPSSSSHGKSSSTKQTKTSKHAKIARRDLRVLELVPSLTIWPLTQLQQWQAESAKSDSPTQPAPQEMSHPAEYHRWDDYFS